MYIFGACERNLTFAFALAFALITVLFFSEDGNFYIMIIHNF